MDGSGFVEQLNNDRVPVLRRIYNICLRVQPAGPQTIREMLHAHVKHVGQARPSPTSSRPFCLGLAPNPFEPTLILPCFARDSCIKDRCAFNLADGTTRDQLGISCLHLLLWVSRVL